MDLDAIRAELLDHADSILSGYRFAEESLDPLLTVASIGCEKVIKMTVGLLHVESAGAWPSKNIMRTDYGHNVILLDQVCRDLMRGRIQLAVARGYVEDLLEGIEADPLVGPFLHLLARYAANGRFYYLDDLADEPQPLPPPSELWEELTSAVNGFDPEVLQPLIAGPYDDAAARTIGHVRTALWKWRNMYWRAWIQGVCGPTASRTPHR